MISLLPRFAADDKGEIYAELYRHNNDEPFRLKSQVAKKPNLFYEISTRGNGASVLSNPLS